MNSEIKQIDQLLNRMDKNTIAISYDQDADTIDHIEKALEGLGKSINAGDKRIHYVEHKGDIEELKAEFDGYDWGEVHPDGKDHLERLKRKRINVQRKKRRFGLR